MQCGKNYSVYNILHLKNALRQCGSNLNCQVFPRWSVNASVKSYGAGVDDKAVMLLYCERRAHMKDISIEVITSG